MVLAGLLASLKLVGGGGRGPLAICSYSSVLESYESKGDWFVFAIKSTCVVTLIFITSLRVF